MKFFLSKLTQRRPRTFENLRVGKPQAYLSMPAHVAGVHEGNDPSTLRKRSGMWRVGDRLLGKARRSTGINSIHRDPIDPDSPNLSPP